MKDGLGGGGGRGSGSDHLPKPYNVIRFWELEEGVRVPLVEQRFSVWGGHHEVPVQSRN